MGLIWKRIKNWTKNYFRPPLENIPIKSYGRKKNTHSMPVQPNTFSTGKTAHLCFSTNCYKFRDDSNHDLCDTCNELWNINVLSWHCQPRKLTFQLEYIGNPGSASFWLLSPERIHADQSGTRAKWVNGSFCKRLRSCLVGWSGEKRRGRWKGKPTQTWGEGLKFIHE